MLELGKLLHLYLLALCATNLESNNQSARLREIYQLLTRLELAIPVPLVQDLADVDDRDFVCANTHKISFHELPFEFVAVTVQVIPNFPTVCDIKAEHIVTRRAIKYALTKVSACKAADIYHSLTIL